MNIRIFLLIAAIMLLTLAGCGHRPSAPATSKEVIEVAGRQGVACDGEYYYVSGSTALYKYTLSGKLVLSNETPFISITEGSPAPNHIGDIDVYKGEIYAGCEYFMDGEGQNIQVAIYDAATLQYKRSVTWNPGSGQVECCGLAVDRKRDLVWMADWVEGPKGQVCRDIMADCDGIVAGLYEYHAAYATVYGEKLAFIPFPVAAQLDKGHIRGTSGGPIRFFIGIQRHRSLYKGTDIMWRALRRVAEAYPDVCEVVRVENVPFAEYCRLMDRSDVILDQLYSYTPAMNALEAMAHGMVVVGGGEPENYAILGEEQLRPIINVQPNERSVYEALSRLVRHPEMIADLSRQSMAYVSRHHDAQKVARQYVDFWTRG